MVAFKNPSAAVLPVNVVISDFLPDVFIILTPGTSAVKSANEGSTVTDVPSFVVAESDKKPPAVSFTEIPITDASVASLSILALSPVLFNDLTPDFLIVDCKPLLR